MDSELLALVQAVREGRMQDVFRCRDVLGEAREAVKAQRKTLHELLDRCTADEEALEEATDAFLDNWQESNEGAC
jgi:uncharacterized protein